MNCLKIDPNLLTKKINPNRRDYNYNCLDHIKYYKIPVKIYYDFLLSIEGFKLKNIWNQIIINWNRMKYELRENKDFIQSDYSDNKYHQIHININDEEFNDLLKDFIKGNNLKCLFICNIVQNNITPK